MLLGCLVAQADTPSVQRVEERPQMALAGKTIRPALLREVQTAFVDGDRVGELHSGAACDTAADRGWSELIHQRVQSELPAVFRDEVSRAGGLLGETATDGAPLHVQAFLNNLDAQVCQAASGAWQGGFYVQVSWQIVSPDSGHVIYQASTEGSFMLSEPQRLPTAAGLRQAFGVAVRNLLSDSRFAALLQSPEPRRVALVY
jgi:hypothetical protein